MECKPGDWVAFYRDGRVIIGRVLYRYKPQTFPYEWELATDIGSTRESLVLERRVEVARDTARQDTP